nr:hypothetical protein [uncultured Oscillibacter sp.]
MGDNSVATNFTEEEISSDEGGYHCLTFGGVNATITGSGTLAATAQASNDGCAILICEDGALTITGDAAVSARVKGEYWGWEDEDGNPVKR